jgi:hypothetical protein
MRFLHFRPEDGSELDIETAVREALANAMVHGNGENPSKRVYVECRCYQTEKSRSPFGTREQALTPAQYLIPLLPKAGCPSTVEVSISNG